METDEYDKLRELWSSEVENRDVYLTAKTSSAWKKVIMRKTVDVDND